MVLGSRRRGLGFELHKSGISSDIDLGKSLDEKTNSTFSNSSWIGAAFSKLWKKL
jgi:hypothetical protein